MEHFECYKEDWHLCKTQASTSSSSSSSFYSSMYVWNTLNILKKINIFAKCNCQLLLLVFFIIHWCMEHFDCIIRGVIMIIKHRMVICTSMCTLLVVWQISLQRTHMSSSSWWSPAWVKPVMFLSTSKHPGSVPRIPSHAMPIQTVAATTHKAQPDNQKDVVHNKNSGRTRVLPAFAHD